MRAGGRFPRIAAGLGLVLLMLCVLLLFSLNAILDGPVRRRLQEAGSAGGHALRLGTLHYSLSEGILVCSALEFSAGKDSASGIRQVVLTIDTVACRGIHWIGVLLGRGLDAEEIAFVRPRCIVLHAKAGADTASPAPTAGEALPDLVRPLRVGMLTLREGTLVGRDTVQECSLTVERLALSSLNGDFESWLSAFRQLTVRARGIALHSPSPAYVVKARSLRVSTDDGSLTLDSLAYVPELPDRAFFAHTPVRTTRFAVICQDVRLRGIVIRDRREGGMGIHSAGIDSFVVDILADKRLPAGRAEGMPPMPNELLAALPWKVALDTLRFGPGMISYAEQFAYSSIPAVLVWTRVSGEATGIESPGRRDDQAAFRVPVRGTGSGADTASGKERYGPDARRAERPVAVLAVSGRLMNSGLMRLALRLPVGGPSFDCAYQGSLGPMEMTLLNRWLEQSDRVRITSGTLQDAQFSVHVKDGQATGAVVPIYRHLTLRLLDKQTGSASGVFKSVGSAMANVFKIQQSNPPDAGDAPRNGRIAYARSPGDTFFRFLWFSLRGGLGNVIGF